MHTFKVLIILLLLPLIAFSQKQDCPHGQYKDWTKEGKEHWKCLDPPLAINLTYFASGFKGDCLMIEWSYTEPINHSHFEIEYSATDNWAVLHKTTDTFVSLCTNLQPGYYRLVSVDTDDTKHYYNIIYFPYSSKKYIVYDLYGRFIGEFNNYLLIPKNTLIIVNGNKIIAR